MAKQEPLERKLVKAYKVKCRGVADSDGNKALSKEDAEAVIIKLYRDAHSEVMCRYIRGGDEFRCGVVPQADERDLPMCPYRTSC